MVPECNKIGFNVVGNTQQKLAPSIARPLFEVRGRNRRIKPVGALDDQLDPESCAHPEHEVFIAIRLITANPMVEMRGHDAEVESLAKIEQRAGKRDGISTTG